MITHVCLRRGTGRGGEKESETEGQRQKQTGTERDLKIQMKYTDRKRLVNKNEVFGIDDSQQTSQDQMY